MRRKLANGSVNNHVRLREASWEFLQHASSKLGPSNGLKNYDEHGEKHLGRVFASAKMTEL